MNLPQTQSANISLDPGQNRIIETKYREEPYADGRLRVIETYVNSQLVTEVFTLESLAYCMGMPMSTMDGRYKRAKLARWMVPVPSMAGRPMRGFPYQLLAPVVQAIMHPHSVVTQDANGSGLNYQRRKQLSELRPEYFNGEPYYTVASLAHSFGLSETTVRNKLNVAGLMKRFQNLSSPAQGGRPKRGIPQRYLAQVKLILDGTARYVTAYDMALMKATGQYQQAKEDVQNMIIPHTPPVKGSMQAWDSYELAPVHKKPVNTVNPGAVDPSIVDLMAEIDQITDKFEVPPLATPTGQPPQMLTPEQAAKAQREEEMANRRAMIEPMRQQLIDDPDEPTDELFADTVYALDLTGDDAKAFVESVKQARLAKQGGV